MNTNALALLATVGLAATVASAPATAKDVTVSYADLDLQTTEGQATLQRRLDRAAEKVCDASDARERMHRQSVRKCYAEATRQSRTSFAAVLDKAAKRATFASK